MRKRLHFKNVILHDQIKLHIFLIELKTSVRIKIKKLTHDLHINK